MNDSYLGQIIYIEQATKFYLFIDRLEKSIFLALEHI
jgi:hypothetical protein